MEKLRFHWADYLVFALSLASSLFIGIYFAIQGRKNATTDDFLLGGRTLSFLPVSFSLTASLLNGVFIIGIPAEIYYFGPVFAFVAVAFLFMAIVVCFVFIPTFHKLKVTSAYEYFDRRYNFRPLRVTVSVIFVVNMLLFLAVVLYAPALAFSEVTGFSMVASVLTSGVVCTIYTGLGGIKAVVWTDTLQMAIVFLGLVVLAIKGVYAESVGEPATVLNRVKDGNRFDFGVWEVDPRVRHTVWTQVIGQGVTWTSVYATNQMAVQRYLAVRSVREAQYAVMLTVGTVFILLSLVCVLAFVMYAYYFDCDPLQAGLIKKADQIVPRFLMEILGNLHGLPGLFTAAVFAASLSSVSSALNSLSAVVLEDMVKPLWRHVGKADMSVQTATRISKLLAIVFGLLTIGMSFTAEFMGDNLAEIPGTVWGALSAPVLGVFILSMFVPWSTALGCFVGLLVSLLLTLWMSVGGVFNAKSRNPLMPLGLCRSNNTPGIMVTSVTSPTIPTEIGTTVYAQPSGPGRDMLQDFYDVSYGWYALIGVCTCVLVGLVISCLSGGWFNKETGELVDPSLMFNSADLCCCCCSTSCKDLVRCGVRFQDERIIDDKPRRGPIEGIINPALDITFQSSDCTTV